jgi:hypothetical protein
MKRLRLLIPFVFTLVLALTTGASAHPPAFTVVASGLDNPRGLEFAPGGALFVAEAGRGGPGPPCITGPEGDQQCLGATGAVTRITRWGQERVVTGLPSLAGPEGAGATGPHDISFSGRRAYIVTGLGAPPSVRDTLGPGGTDLGRLLRIRRDGTWTSQADIAAYEAAADPDGQGPFTNPYAVLAKGGRQYVVDAGGNSLLRVARDGGISTFSVFPTREAGGHESVPDSIVAGPGGGLFVGEFTGGPFPVGGANVYRVEPGEPPEVYAGGFTNIIDIAFDHRTLYVLEFDHDGLLGPGMDGALIRVDRDGSRTVIETKRPLTAPGGLAIRHGFAYVSNCGACPAGLGEVVRVRLGHEEDD